jgi:hypothetical protein
MTQLIDITIATTSIVAKYKADKDKTPKMVRILRIK